MASSVQRFDGKLLQFSSSIEVSTRSKAFRRAKETGIRNAMAAVAAKALEYARENVSPEKGPGPHPHRTDHGWAWEDTEELSKSLRLRFRQKGFIRIATIFTPLDYGMYLEVGWRGPSGRHYRYPWLRPAFIRAQSEFPKMVASWMRQAIEKAGGKSEVYGNDWVKKMIRDFELNQADDVAEIPDSSLRSQIGDALGAVESHHERTRRVLRALHRASRGSHERVQDEIIDNPDYKERRRRHAGDVLRKTRQDGTGVHRRGRS